MKKTHSIMRAAIIAICMGLASIGLTTASTPVKTILPTPRLASTFTSLLGYVVQGFTANEFVIDPVSVDNGQVYLLQNMTAADQTWTSVGPDPFNIGAGNVASIIIPAGDVLLLRSDGTRWRSFSFPSPPVLVKAGNCITVTGNGKVDTPYIVGVTPGCVAISTQTTETINLQGDGTAATPLAANVIKDERGEEELARTGFATDVLLPLGLLLVVLGFIMVKPPFRRSEYER